MKSHDHDENDYWNYRITRGITEIIELWNLSNCRIHHLFKLAKLMLAVYANNTIAC